MELFVFVVTGGEEDQIEWVELGDGAEVDVRAFDVRQAQCTLIADSDRLLSTIDATFEGIDKFNASIRDLLYRATEKRSSARPAPELVWRNTSFSASGRRADRRLQAA